MKQTKRLLYFVIYWVLYSGLLYRYVIYSEYLQLVPDAIVFYLYFKNQKKLNVKLRNRFLGKAIPVLFITILLMGVVSSFISMNNPISILWGVRMIGRFSLLMLLVMHYFDSNDIVKIKKIIYKSYGVCIVFCLLQFFQGVLGDSMGGIFMGNPILAAYIILIMLIAAGDYFNHEISRIKFFLIVSGFILIAIWAEIKLLYYILPFTFYGMYVFIKKITAQHIVVFIFAYFFLIPTLKYMMSFYYNEDYIENTFDIQKMDEYNKNDYSLGLLSMNRGTAIETTTTLIIPTMPQLLIGHGIGSGSNSKIFGGHLKDNYAYTCYYFFATSYILAELGWLGFILVLVTAFLLAKRFYNFYSKYRTDPSVKYWASCGVMSVMMSVILGYYSHEAYIDFYLYYAFWGVCFVAIQYSINKLSKEK